MTIIMTVIVLQCDSKGVLSMACRRSVWYLCGTLMHVGLCRAYVGHPIRQSANELLCALRMPSVECEELS